jgi:hypothetical protein
MSSYFDGWIYNNIEFTEDMIPEGAVGFVYEMTAVIDGESRIYIGKKNFYSDVKTKLGKKVLAQQTDKRLKTYKRVRKTVYQKYYSSNEVLKKAHKDGVKIRRKILMICYSPTELTYQEAKYLFCNDVLDYDMYLNSNILGKFYKTK